MMNDTEISTALQIASNLGGSNPKERSDFDQNIVMLTVALIARALRIRRDSSAQVVPATPPELPG